MGILGVAGNLFVIVSRMVFREPNRVHSFYIKNLALADLLMGLYLLSIAFHDISFRGEFLAHQYKWRHSWICQYSGMYHFLLLLLFSTLTNPTHPKMISMYLNRAT